MALGEGGQRCRPRLAAAPGGPIWLADDQANVVSGLDERAQAGHCEGRASEEDQPHNVARQKLAGIIAPLADHSACPCAPRFQSALVSRSGMALGNPFNSVM